MDRDYILEPDQALEYGLIDRIIEQPRIDAGADAIALVNVDQTSGRQANSLANSLALAGRRPAPLSFVADCGAGVFACSAEMAKLQRQAGLLY